LRGRALLRRVDEGDVPIEQAVDDLVEERLAVLAEALHGLERGLAEVDGGEAEHRHEADEQEEAAAADLRPLLAAAHARRAARRLARQLLVAAPGGDEALAPAPL